MHKRRKIAGDPATWGYHDSLAPSSPYPNLLYAYVMHTYPTNLFAPYQSIQPLSYHLVEMITDASAQHLPAWETIGQTQEIADICERPVHDYLFQGYHVSSFWSEQRQRCVGCNAKGRDIHSLPSESSLHVALLHTALCTCRWRR